MKLLDKLINLWESIDGSYKTVIIIIIIWVFAFGLFIIAWNNMFININ